MIIYHILLWFSFQYLTSKQLSKNYIWNELHEYTDKPRTEQINENQQKGVCITHRVLVIIKKQTKTEFELATQPNKHTSVPARLLRIFLATAPAATLPMVSLAEDLPPPFNYNLNSDKLGAINSNMHIVPLNFNAKRHLPALLWHHISCHKLHLHEKAYKLLTFRCNPENAKHILTLQSILLSS